MNEMLEAYARTWLKEHVPTLPIEWQHKFKQMYGQTQQDWAKASVADVIDHIYRGKLDWAMQQVRNSLTKLARTAPDAVQVMQEAAAEEICCVTPE